VVRNLRTAARRVSRRRFRAGGYRAFQPEFMDGRPRSSATILPQEVRTITRARPFPWLRDRANRFHHSNKFDPRICCRSRSCTALQRHDVPCTGRKLHGILGQHHRQPRRERPIKLKVIGRLGIEHVEDRLIARDEGNRGGVPEEYDAVGFSLPEQSGAHIGRMNMVKNVRGPARVVVGQVARNVAERFPHLGGSEILKRQEVEKIDAPRLILVEIVIFAPKRTRFF
jgi:hypothetical protein